MGPPEAGNGRHLSLPAAPPLYCVLGKKPIHNHLPLNIGVTVSEYRQH